MSKNSNFKEDCKIQVAKDGPSLVSGGIPLFRMTIKCDKQGIPIEWVIGKKLQTPENYSLCRAGTPITSLSVMECT